ncbi:MAG: Pycsar system effector family protein [Bacteroidota bacterium]
MNETAKEGMFYPSSRSNPRPILEAAHDHVLALFNRQRDTRLVYHNYHRGLRILETLGQIARAEQANAEVQETAELAACFYAIGHLKNYKQAAEARLEEARQCLGGLGYDPARLQAVLDCLRAVNGKESPGQVEARLLKDAIQAVNLASQFFDQRPLLRLEWEMMENRRLSTYEWHHLMLQDLLGAHFCTAHAKAQYEPLIGQQLLIQKDKAEKSARNRPTVVDGEDGQSRPFQNLERKLPTSATQTFFRANYRNHINLSAIADNKANIMISVNAILISVIISILSYRNVPDTHPMVLLPVVIFLVTGLASLICAVLSIRPKVTTRNEGVKTVEEAKRNVVFFGNFVDLEEEQFEQALDAVLRDGELLYGNMARDLYHLGKVLDQKYRYLTMSYNIFMLGFVATVLTFLFAIFM